MDSRHFRRKRTGVVRVVILVLLLAIFGAAIYVYQSRGGSMGGLFSSVKATSTDVATAAKVKTALALSETVSAFDVNVDSENRIVRLTGEVPSEEVKSLAGAIAEDTQGVERVQNDLTVDPSARPNAEIKSLNDRIADLELEARINETLSRNRQIKTKAIDVQVENKKVVLSGTVDALAQKYQAEQIVREVEGVAAVENRLNVPQSTPPESLDEKLRHKVEFELYATKAFDLTPIQVQAQAGVVNLSGSVRSRAEKLLAERITKEIEGVERVVNNLEIPEES